MFDDSEDTTPIITQIPEIHTNEEIDYDHSENKASGTDNAEIDYVNDEVD